MAPIEFDAGYPGSQLGRVVITSGLLIVVYPPGHGLVFIIGGGGGWRGFLLDGRVGGSSLGGGEKQRVVLE